MQHRDLTDKHLGGHANLIPFQTLTGLLYQKIPSLLGEAKRVKRIFFLVMFFWLAQPGLTQSPDLLYYFELGEVIRPKDTVERTLPTDNGITHMLVRGERTAHPSVFLLTVTNDGASLGQETSNALQALSRDYCKKLGLLLGVEIETTEVRDDERGCRFYFRVKGGRGDNYGRIFLGRTRTLVMVGLGVSRREFNDFVNSLESSPQQFERPLSRRDSAYRVTAGAAWLFGLMNVLFAIIVGCLAMLFDRPFLKTCRNTLIVVALGEVIWGACYSYQRWESAEIARDIAVGAFAGLLVTTGGPALLAHELSRQTLKIPKLFQRK